jgi:hypothetical protein
MPSPIGGVSTLPFDLLQSARKPMAVRHRAALPSLTIFLAHPYAIL